MKIYTIKNLNLKDEVILYKKSYLEKYQWLIHKIIEENLYHKNKEYGGYVNLSSAIMNEFIGERFFKKVKQHLIISGIIEENKRYSTGKFSKSFRLSQKHLAAGAEIVKVNGGKWKSYISKLNDFYQLSLQHFKNQKFPYQVMRNNLELLLFDNIGAKMKIDSLCGTPDFTDGKYWSYNMYSHMMKEKVFFFHPDKTTGRVYHNLANLPSLLRPYIYHNSGQKLVQVDMSNSQPFLFIKLLQEYWLKKGKINISYQYCPKRF